MHKQQTAKPPTATHASTALQLFAIYISMPTISYIHTAIALISILALVPSRFSTFTMSDVINKKRKSNPPSAPFRRSKVVLLGDSITQLSFSAKLSGWGTYIADVYQRRCDVFNRGMSGYNTDWFLQYLSTEEGKYDVFDSLTNNGVEDGVSDVKLVTIFFGANDQSCEKLNRRHHVPLPKFQSNLKEIAKLCRENYGEKVRIILITPPPVHHDSRLKYQVERYGDKATGQLERTMELASKYSDAVKAVAKELGYPCLNIYQSMQDSEPGTDEKWSKYLSDGLHLSAEGNLFVGKELKKLIDEVYPEITINPCPYTELTGNWGNSATKGGDAFGTEKGMGPWHDEIDHMEAEKSFQEHTNKKMKTL